MSAAKDPTSIGSLLLAMGAVTHAQLQAAVVEQEQLPEDVRLGKLLVANNWCTPEDLKEAIDEQERIRDKNGYRKAHAAAQIAKRRGLSHGTLEQRQRTIQKSAEITRAISAHDLRLATGLLANGSNGK